MSFEADGDMAFISCSMIEPMDWFKGKSVGHHGFSYEIYGCPVNVPLNQSID
jgi:hypothetical protein